MLIGPIELIKVSWKLYKENWKKFLVYLGLLFIPTGLLTSLGIIVGYVDTYNPSLTPVNTLVVVAVFAASIVFSIWISISIMQVIKKLYKKEPLEDWKKTISNNSRYIWPSIWVTIITTILVLFGCLLFLVPGIIFSIWYAFSFYSVVFENKTGMDAMRSSKALVVGRFWKIFLSLLLPALFFGIIGSLISYLLNLPFGFIKNEILSAIVYNVFTVIAEIIMTPLISSATVILFLSAKENPVETTPKTVA